MKNYLTTLLLLISYSFIAQNLQNSIPATITYKSGIINTININKKFLANSKVIEVRLTESGEFNKVSPQKIKSIVAQDNSFIISSFEYNDQHFFLNQLIGGEAELYSYFDSSGNIQYVSRTEDFGYRVLKNDKSAIKKDGKEFNQNSKAYLGVLSLIFSDCNENINLEKINLTAKSLSKAFSTYNTCKSSLTYISPTLQKTTKFRIGLLGGMDVNNLKLETPVADNADGKVSYTLGAEFVVIPNFFQSRLSPFLSFNYAETGGTAGYLSTPEFDQLILDYKMIELDLGLRYSLTNLNSKVVPFIGLSVGKKFILNYEEAILKVRSDNTTDPEPLYEGNPFRNPESSTPISLNYQAGLNYNLNSNQGLILKIGYSSFKSFAEFQSNRINIEVGYYFNL